MKQTWRQIAAAALVSTCIIGGSAAPAFAYNDTATQVETTIEPRYTGVSRSGCRLSISSKNAVCSGVATLKSGFSSKLTLTLQKKSSGKWSTVQTWSGSGSSIRKSCKVSSGTYRAVLTAKIYNSSGKYVETATATSETASC